MNLFEAGDNAFTEAARDQVLAQRPALTGRLTTIGARPENLRLLDDGEQPPAGTHVFEATVKTALPTGSSWTVLVRAGETELYLVSYTDVCAAPGSVVRCAVRTSDLHLFDASGDRLPDAADDTALTEENTATWAS